MIELDTNILQTKTVKSIVKVLKQLEPELLGSDNKANVDQIINRHEIALTMMKRTKEHY
tara:strand:- start:1292 stop:1468 length:177 start_codon:yes stop_codon:yes gene_type:complete